MRWVIIWYAKVAVISCLIGIIFTTNVNAWSTSSPPSFTASDVKVNNSDPCPGIYGTISVSGEGTIRACIMGETTKVASYFPAQGGVSYAVSFPFEDTYYILDVCQGVWGCVYTDESDTLAGITGIYKQFVKNLKKDIQNGVTHYGLSEQSSIFSLSRFDGKSYSPQAVAISQNGKWVLLELRQYGFLRINVQTLEIRRIIAPGINYGYGYDPRVEMAVSNDGKTALIVGTRMSVWVVSINETCGDIPNAFMQPQYTGAVTSCDYVPTQTSSYIPSFSYASRPKISHNDKTLSFDIFSKTIFARHITLFSETNTPQEDSYYLAMGDSFTSGQGETDDSYYVGGAANKCHLSSRSYPFLLATSWSVLGNSTACSGATIPDARGHSPNIHQYNQLAELESRLPQVVTVGIGGNDVGLIGKLQDCIRPNTCKWANSTEDRRNTAMEIKSLYPRLKEFYQDVKMRTLGPVIIVGYPRIISDQSSCSSFVGGLLNQTERIFMNEAIHYLNQVIQAATIDSGVAYADVENAFDGSELCSSAESLYMNGVRLGDDLPEISLLPFIKVIGAESFHPKPAGHVKLAEKIYQSFPSFTHIDTYMNNGVPTTVPAPSTYWDSVNTRTTPQRAISFLTNVTIKKKDVFKISFPAFTFSPSSDIVLELHSDVKNLGTVQSSEDGSLNTTISSEDFDIGVHSVHAIGKNFNGDSTDNYDFLTVEEDEVAIAVAVVPTIIAPQASNSPSPSVPKKVENDENSGVLGSSAERLAILDSITSVKKSQQLQPTQQKADKNYRYNWVVILIIIACLGATIITIYFYNRQKPHRN